MLGDGECVAQDPDRSAAARAAWPHRRCRREPRAFPAATPAAHGRQRVHAPCRHRAGLPVAGNAASKLLHASVGERLGGKPLKLCRRSPWKGPRYAGCPRVDDGQAAATHADADALHELSERACLGHGGCVLRSLCGDCSCGRSGVPGEVRAPSARRWSCPRTRAHGAACAHARAASRLALGRGFLLAAGAAVSAAVAEPRESGVAPQGVRLPMARAE